jgi:hypothetical protein
LSWVRFVGFAFCEEDIRRQKANKQQAQEDRSQKHANRTAAKKRNNKPQEQDKRHNKAANKQSY